jgi:hypothetical protein
MRRLRDWRLLAIALGFFVGTAVPASVAAHALAHDRDAHEAHPHAGSPDDHGGSAELSTPGHASGHQHARLDQARRTSPPPLVLGPAVAASAPTLDAAPTERAPDVPPSSLQAPDPPGNDPPRLRAPPLY